MIASINREYRSRIHGLAEDAFILESVLSVEEVLPGSDEEMEDIIDVDSVPADKYAALDQMLDKIVDSPDYDDSEADELADDDFDENEVDDSELDAIMESACGEWLDEGAVAQPVPDSTKRTEAGKAAINAIRQRRGLKPLKEDEGDADDLNEKWHDPSELNKKMSQYAVDRKKHELDRKQQERYARTSMHDDKPHTLAADATEEDPGLDEEPETTMQEGVTNMYENLRALAEGAITPEELDEASKKGDVGLKVRAKMNGVTEEQQKKIDKKGGELMDELGKKQKKGKRKIKLIEALKKSKKKAAKKKKNEGAEGEVEEFDENTEQEITEAVMSCDIDTMIENCEDMSDEDFDKLCEDIGKCDDIDEACKKCSGKKSDTPVKKESCCNENATISPYAKLRAIVEGCGPDGCGPDAPEDMHSQAQQMGTAKPTDDFQDWEDKSCPHGGEPEEMDQFPRGGNFDDPEYHVDD